MISALKRLGRFKLNHFGTFDFCNFGGQFKVEVVGFSTLALTLALTPDS